MSLAHSPLVIIHDLRYSHEKRYASYEASTSCISYKKSFLPLSLKSDCTKLGVCLCAIDCDPLLKNLYWNEQKRIKQNLAAHVGRERKDDPSVGLGYIEVITTTKLCEATADTYKESIWTKLKKKCKGLHHITTERISFFKHQLLSEESKHLDTQTTCVASKPLASAQLIKCIEATQNLCNEKHKHEEKFKEILSNQRDLDAKECANIQDLVPCDTDRNHCSTQTSRTCLASKRDPSDRNDHLLQLEGTKSSELGPPQKHSTSQSLPPRLDSIVTLAQENHGTVSSSKSNLIKILQERVKTKNEISQKGNDSQEQNKKGTNDKNSSTPHQGVNFHKPPPVIPEVHRGKTRPGRPKLIEPHFNIMLQAFNWESQAKKPWWKHIATKVEEIAEAGFTDVWLPPCSQSVDKHGYLPSQLYNLDASSYGTEIMLKELNDKLHEFGLFSIADIVVNHRSGSKQDATGHWNVYEGGTLDKRLAWGPWAVVDNDTYNSGGKGKHDSGESYGAAPDLDHTNKRVQDELTDWLNWLKAEVGFDGWRFDFVKGYAPKYTGIYCERTNPVFAVGEFWTSLHYDGSVLALDQNSHRQLLCDWIDGTGGCSAVFDFTTKGVLQTAVQGELWRLKDVQGKAPGLLGWYPQRAVTFVDNHDTGSTQCHWVFPNDKVFQGYAYIITHPGIPCVFYDHFFDWPKGKETISELIAVRKRNCINANSKLVINIAEADIYVATIDDRVIIKMGPRMDMGALLPDATWKMVASGADYAIWESEKSFPSKTTVIEQTDETNLDELVEHPVTHSQPHPIKVTNKMSPETVKKILEEAPDVVGKPHRDVQQKSNNKDSHTRQVVEDDQKKLDYQKKKDNPLDRFFVWKKDDPNETISGDD